MAPIETLSIFFILFFLSYTATSLETCITSFCPGTNLPVKFPFRLTNSISSTRCGYEGFNISCTNETQPILNLPESKPFTVQYIDYQYQNIWINDPDDCMPQRFLKGFNLSRSPFNADQYAIFSFLNCSNPPEMAGYRILIPCLSGDNYTVMAMPISFSDQSIPSSCSVIKRGVLVPISWPFGGLNSDVQLTWSDPNCVSCEERGETCGFTSETGSDVGCSNRKNGGIPRSAKYGMIIGAGIPGLLCLIGLSCYACGKVRDYNHRRRHPNTEFSTSITPHPAVIVMGLDGRTIEKFPKTLLGESGRLPKPSDNVCPICLSEYEPKETLRTIPECNHYFHANCIDEWLRVNATCPLCRNSPDESSIMSPSSSMSISSSSSSF